MPGNAKVGVKSLAVNGQRVNSVHTGQLCEIAVALPNDFDPGYIKQGNVICDPKFPIHQVRDLRAQIAVFEVDIPITRGQNILLYSFSNQCAGKIARLESIVNPKSGESIKKNPKCLIKNQNAVVRIKLEERACLELFSNYRSMGRITLREAGKTIAAGIIIELIN